MATLTPEERARRAGAIAHITCNLDEDGCGRGPGQECVSTTGSGRTVTPHAIRKHDFDVWISRQPEVDELKGQLTQAAAQNTDLSRRVTESAEDLATAQANAASLAEQLRAARAGAALVPGLQAQIVDLRAKIALLEKPPVEVLIKMDLNAAGVSLGQATAVGMGKAFGQPGKIGADTTWRDFTIGADPDGRRYLRWTSRRNTEGSANGISLAIPLSRPVDDATYEADMRFSPGFGPSMGGKTPGLSMTVPGESGTLASGGRDPGDTAGSARGMFLAAIAGIFPQPDGSKLRALAPFELPDYVYQKGKVEQERMTRFVPPTGQIITARRRAVMNTVGKADGLLQSWYGVKGQLLQVGRDDQAETWRTRADLQVSHLFWSIFRGGPNNAPQWADDDDVADYIDFFDGLTVTTPAA